MKRLCYFWLLSILPFFTGCTAFQVRSDIQAGRQALLLNRPEDALPYFQRVVQADPNFVMGFGVFQEGAWTYVGRANYGTGRLSEAKQALERALARDDDDNLARLYLGLVLTRDGDRQTGAKQIEGGIRGLHDWLEYINYNTIYGMYWDPRREIRSEIRTDLALLSGKEIDWQKVIASSEWIGFRMEEEIDRARRDEMLLRHNQGDNDRP
jgi:tetratricopeptide (TPR) repeat protein